ncbi:MAG: type II toxin-antitoxin system RelE/ParE family toxin [Thermodesulfobacteriota bacterium]
MKVFQSRSFERKVKKFSKTQKLELDEQIKRIVEDPSIGTEKKGDLRGIHIHKFKIKTTRYLLAYRIIEENLELIMVGLHENYYRNLKKYIKST